MAALFLPLFGVIWFAQGYFSNQQPAEVAAPPPVASTVLRESLERAASEQLKIEPIEDERVVLTIPTTEEGRPAKLESLQATVKASGGTAIELAENHYLISGPAGIRAAVSTALLGSAPSESASATGETELFEVKLSP